MRTVEVAVESFALVRLALSVGLGVVDWQPQLLLDWHDEHVHVVPAPIERRELEGESETSGEERLNSLIIHLLLSAFVRLAFAYSGLASPLHVRALSATTNASAKAACSSNR